MENQNYHPSPPLIPFVALTNDNLTDFCMHVQTKIYKLQLPAKFVVVHRYILGVFFFPFIKIIIFQCV